MAEHGNSIEALARRVGAAEPVLRLMVGLLTGKLCPGVCIYLSVIFVVRYSIREKGNLIHQA